MENNEINEIKKEIEQIKNDIQILSAAINSLVPPGSRIVEGRLYAPVNPHQG